MQACNKPLFVALAAAALVFHGASAQDAEQARVEAGSAPESPAQQGEDTAVEGEVAAADSEPTFNIWEIRVRGNTLLSNEIIERIVLPYLGPERSFDDLQAVSTELQKSYRDAGYPTVYVSIPEQNITDGLVRLEVLEGTIDRVKVAGSRYYSNDWIRRNVPEAQSGNIPRLGDFNRQLNQLNSRTQDRDVTPILRPGREPGTVELELKVNDSLPLHGGIEVNNRNTVDTTDTRLVADLNYTNLWQRDHNIGFLYQVAPEDSDESEVFSLNYTFRPEQSETTYAFYGIKSDSNIETSGALGVIGQGKIIGGRAIRPIPGTDKLFHSVVLGADWKDFDEAIGFEDEVETPITYLNWTAGYTGAYLEETRRHNMQLNVNFGIRGIVNDQDEFSDFAEFEDGSTNTGACDPNTNSKRCGSKPNYYYFRGSYDVLQKLPWDTSVFFRTTGQYSNDPLISNEQFAVGGLDTVRGYFEAEALGDYGIHTTLELRSPNFGSRLWSRIRETYIFGFGDLARLGNQRAPGDDEEDRSQRISSVGIGLNFKALGFIGRFSWARPLQDGPVTEDGDDEVLFLTRYEF